MTFPYLKRVLVLGGVVLVAVAVSFHEPNKPRALTVGQVPVAFWSWRTRVPSQAEIEESFAPTHAKILFLRAGQFDIESDGVHRIRPVTGTLPPRVETHLVYNATRKFLGEFERLDVPLTAKAIADTYREDLARANHDRANIRGFQLDFDVPSRLLPNYATLLESLRQTLPRDTQISITGLPAWTASNDLSLVLDKVDFWIPQFYGGDLPTHASERIPIASPTDVARSTARVRQLGKPFYAGLSAYGYAILYAKDGTLVELRGNIDPAHAALERNLELLERKAFSEGSSGSEIRYTYRATAEVVLDGLVLHKNETLVFDLPTAESLRTSARAVRETAGELLLGICMFRLPTGGDHATLSVAEISSALADMQTQVVTTITVNYSETRQLVLEAANDGNTSSVMGEEAMTVDLPIEPESIEILSDLAGFDSYETLCDDSRPCSSARASLIRLKASSWRPGNTASVRIRLKRDVPPKSEALVTTHIDDGRVDRQMVKLQPVRGNKNEL